MTHKLTSQLNGVIFFPSQAKTMFFFKYFLFKNILK
jgi:hypothetical protein